MEILLVIDIQQRYMKNYDDDLLTRVNRRIHSAVKQDVPVVYVRNMGKLEAAERYDFAPNLDIVTDVIFDKSLPSAFSSTEFVDYIKRLGVEEISIIGVDGRCCVPRTAMDAVNNGYKTRLYLDAVAARSDKFYSKELEEMKEAGVIVE